MDQIIDLTDDAEEVLEQILHALIDLERSGEQEGLSSQSHEERGATVTIDHHNNKKTVVYDSTTPSYYVYSGLCEHSDYKTGYLLNYLKIAVRARNELVGKVLIRLLHDSINGNMADITIDEIAERLRDEHPDGFTLNGRRLPIEQYPLHRVLDEMAKDDHYTAVKHDVGKNPIITHELRGYDHDYRKVKIVVQRHVMEIDLWWCR